MSEKRETPPAMGSSEREAALHLAEANAEDDEDVYAQLAQKERDLILAAELGKALLDSNQELQSRYDQMVEEYTHKFEELQQEKYDLHLELEKMETEYQNAIKDLQDDVAALRKQVRASDELQVSERERSRSLREAQQNSDYLMEQVKKATLREEELMKELDQLKIREESGSATIKDQIEHIAMLRDQVEHLSEKLQETNQKLMKIQGERDVLMNTLEATQESMQNLEAKLSQQDAKIQRQTSDIEELQESNSDLMQQLQQRHSSHYHQQQQSRASYLSSKSGNIISRHNNNNNNSVNGSRQKSHNLYFELNQEKQKELSLYPQPLTQSQVNQQQTQGHNAEGQSQVECIRKQQDLLCDGLAEKCERSLCSEVKLEGSISGSNSSPLQLTECSSLCRHNINTNDCSICYVAEGSRKRHHQNVGGSSDDDDDDRGDNGPKQSLFSKSCISGFDPRRSSASSAIDSNGNRVSFLIPSQYEDHGSYRRDSAEHSLASELIQRGSTEALSGSHGHLHSGSFQKSWLPLNTSQENLIFGDLPSQFEDKDTSYDGGEDNEKSLFSELSPFVPEFCPRYQDLQERSLFSELSSQIYEDKNGTGSDSSSSYMLGAFDFSGNDAQDADRNSNESLNRSMEMRSRIESDMISDLSVKGVEFSNVELSILKLLFLRKKTPKEIHECMLQTLSDQLPIIFSSEEMSYVSDWYYMTPMTSEMLEEDDFECDDDDFLVGNMAGTTLSISDSDHGLSHYQYHSYMPVESRIDHLSGDIPCSEAQGSKSFDEQAQLSEACRQLKELVIRVQGEDSTSVDSTRGIAQEDKWKSSTDVLLSLVAELRVCFDRIATVKAGELQSSDISTTVKNEVKANSSVPNSECQVYQDKSGEQHHHPGQQHLDVGRLAGETRGDSKEIEGKQIRKSKSSSALV